MKEILEVVYIVPSRYDDEGYVLKWWKGVVPSNSLGCLVSLTKDIAEKGELGDVEVKVSSFDDSIDTIPIKKLIRKHKKAPGSILVGLVGVQTGQFARAADLALALRAGGVPVMIGGFHVSGIMALFDKPTHEMQHLIDQGVTLVRGEAESPGALIGILRDAIAGELKPLYNLGIPADITKSPVPKVDMNYLKRFNSMMVTIDTSRGCPYGCTFCTIINVQGRKMRCRSAEAILTSIRENHAQGARVYFFTDDNFSRSPVWEQVLDGISAMRGEGIEIDFMIQIDTQAYTIPHFIEKVRDAGCRMVFIGMESVNPKNLEATGKKQNHIEAYRTMVSAWQDAGILVHVGYIIGMPYDSLESVRSDVEFLRDEIKVHEASFFMLTPLPGSIDHKNMVEQGVPMDADTNSFDSNHETFHHPNFQPGQWLQAFHEAYEMFYNKENTVDVLLRTPRNRYWLMFWTLVWYRYAGVYAKAHPMAVGILRQKKRKERRPSFEQEGYIPFTVRRIKDYWWGFKVFLWISMEFQEVWMLTRKKDDPRWTFLADLRLQYAELRKRVVECNISGRCDAAAQEVRTLLQVASTRFRELSQMPKQVGGHVARRLARTAREIDRYLQSFEKEQPDRTTIERAHAYISQRLLTQYEEMAIQYVALRRRFNTYRHELGESLRRKRFFSLRILHLPPMLAGEIILAARFWYTAFTRGI